MSRKVANKKPSASESPYPVKALRSPPYRIRKPRLNDAREELRQEVDNFVRFLREEVFVEANLVAQETTDTQVTYRLGANVLCDAEPSTQLPTGTSAPSEPALDPECVANAERAKLRVRLSQPRENDVDMTIVASDDNLEPLVVQLYQDRLGVKVDLVKGLKTLQAMGETEEEVISVSGALQLQVIKNSAMDYSAQFSILNDVALSLQGDNGEQYVYSVAKSSPAIELRADGNSKTVSAAYNYGAIQLLGPFSAFVESYLHVESATDAKDPAGSEVPPPEPSYTGVVELLLAGYTGKVSYTADSDTFLFSDVSLGSTTSTLKHDGELLAALDLNPTNGRRFNATVRPRVLADGNTSALFTLDPTVDVNLALSFKHIADQVADLDPTLQNDDLRVWFTGTEATFAIEEERLRMISGAFHISSKQNPQSNVDVPTGMCLAKAEPDAGDINDGADDEATTENLFAAAVVDCQ
jgi:hypothetical protein